jgi:hypothetical protein
MKNKSVNPNFCTFKLAWETFSREITLTCVPFNTYSLYSVLHICQCSQTSHQPAVSEAALFHIGRRDFVFQKGGLLEDLVNPLHSFRTNRTWVQKKMFVDLELAVDKRIQAIPSFPFQVPINIEGRVAVTHIDSAALFYKLINLGPTFLYCPIVALRDEKIRRNRRGHYNSARRCAFRGWRGTGENLRRFAELRDRKPGPESVNCHLRCYLFLFLLWFISVRPWGWRRRWARRIPSTSSTLISIACARRGRHCVSVYVASYAPKG